mmetsp:Transcript_17163/g.54579  ORF Transcript_17163/g.54579 Transcript_17163/m.54579 type:complete len:390 (+) Transcript_17163:59-1228(+)
MVTGIGQGWSGQAGSGLGWRGVEVPELQHLHGAGRGHRRGAPVAGAAAHQLVAAAREVEHLARLALLLGQLAEHEPLPRVVREPVVLFSGAEAHRGGRPVRRVHVQLGLFAQEAARHQVEDLGPAHVYGAYVEAARDGGVQVALLGAQQQAPDCFERQRAGRGGVLSRAMHAVLVLRRAAAPFQRPVHVVVLVVLRLEPVHVGVRRAEVKAEVRARRPGGGGWRWGLVRVREGQFRLEMQGRALVVRRQCPRATAGRVWPLERAVRAVVVVVVVVVAAAAAGVRRGGRPVGLVSGGSHIVEGRVRWWGEVRRGGALVVLSFYVDEEACWAWRDGLVVAWPVAGQGPRQERVRVSAAPAMGRSGVGGAEGAPVSGLLVLLLFLLMLSLCV